MHHEGTYLNQKGRTIARDKEPNEKKNQKNSGFESLLPLSDLNTHGGDKVTFFLSEVVKGERERPAKN